MYDRAFGHVDAGCHLQRRSIGYDPAAEIAEIDRIIHTHTRALDRRRTVRLSRRGSSVRRRAAAHRHDAG